MNRKLATFYTLATLLTFTLSMSLKVQMIRASGTIYIRANGSVEGTDKIVSGDNVTYTFTGNINDSIVLERDNIVVDGAGYTVQGIEAYPSKGIDLTGRSNVTIKNTKITNFWSGIWLQDSSNNSIGGNNITNNGHGISLYESSFNSISGNNITNNTYGVWLDYFSNNNSIVGNNIKNNTYGVWLSHSSNNGISENNMTTNNGDGVWLQSSSNNNIISGNNIKNNTHGINLISSSNNSIAGNNITNKYDGINLYYYSSNNSIAGNNITNNRDGITFWYSSKNTTIVGNKITENSHSGVCTDVFSNYISIFENNITENKGSGIYLQSSNNSIVRNNIKNNSGDGIDLSDFSNYNSICDNNITNNGYGIGLFGSSNNSIVGNKITENNNDGIYLDSSSNTTVAGNIITNNVYDGIYLWYSSNNSIVENKITENKGSGIYLISSSSNSIAGNNITNNYYNGIMIDYSSNNNSIFGNDITNNGYGIYLVSSSDNSIIGNVFTNNGLVVEDSYGNVVDNLVNGKPLIYLEAVSGVKIEDAGQVILINCDSINVENLDLSYTDIGIQLENTTNTKIVGNKITENNNDGIWLENSSNNGISGNNITNNKNGIALYSSSSNRIYHNNFIDNTCQVYDYSWDYPEVSPSINTWDDGYPSGGDYWSNYTGVDSDHDGIGNTPQSIDVNNTDHYPLMGMFHSFNTSYGYAVDFVSNSSISDVRFNISPIEVYPPEAILAFNVSGKTDTEGFLRVCISKILINGSYVIRFDGEIITNTTYPQVRELPCSNETYVYFYINYTHSEHTIIITGTTVIPEFPSFLILPMFIIATLLTVMICRKKRIDTK